MGCPRLYEYDLPSIAGNLEKVAESFGIVVQDTEVWEIVRHQEQIPHIGNEYLKILFERLEEKLLDTFPNLVIQHEANALASYFQVNGQNFYSISELMLIIEDDE